MGEKAKEFSNYNWMSLEKRLFQMVISNSSEAMINWGTTVESSKNSSNKLSINFVSRIISKVL